MSVKRIYIFILITAVIILSTGAYFLWGRNAKSISYQTEKISRGEISISVRATGTIDPLLTVQIGSQVSGTISKLFVDYNSSVKKGQIMAQIDTTFLAATVRSSRANVQEAKAVAKNAKINLDRTTDLHAKSLASDASFDSAKTAYNSAIADLNLAQATLNGDLTNLGYAAIRSPIDGEVVSRQIDVGQTVAASYQTPQLFSVANDLKHMQVEASVDEADIGQVKTGQTATFTVDAYPDIEFSGTVSQVRLNPVIDQNVTTYSVIVLVDNPELKLRPGMTATITILIQQRENVLRTPDLALRFSPPTEVLARIIKETSIDTTGMLLTSYNKKNFHRGNQGRIWVLGTDKIPRPISITTGLDNSHDVEITGGSVNEGDEVILGLEGVDLAEE